MKYTVLPVLTLLVACATPTSEWSKAGADALDVERQMLICTQQAQQSFPVERASTGLRGAVTVGGRFCDGPLCVGLSKGLGDAVANSDSNASLRKRAVDVCMADAGFTR